MTQKNLLARTSIGAIAALMALSSTPAWAQVAEPAPDATTSVESTAPASDPLSVDPAPVVETAPAETSTTAEPVAAPAPAATSARSTATRARTATARAATNVSPRTATPAPVATTSAEPAAPSAPEPMAVPDAATVPPMAPVVSDAPAAAEPTMANDLLPIAGAAGLGVLAILGIGLALRRRRRDEAADEMVHDEPQFVTAAPVVAEPATERSAFAWGQPARTAQTMRDAPTTDGPATPLPRGFDISRFGRHVQAAYRGPSADNPSLSLKKRLKRAAFFDLRERQESRSTGAARPAFGTGFAYTKAVPVS